jgi:ferritin-like metal-binding protein YciE
MQIATLNDLFLHTLKDIHYAETKILKALPSMIKAAEHDELREALTTHRGETEQQIERIREVFSLLGKKPGSEECEAINGILEEGKGVLEDVTGPAVNLGIIASAQAVEHYEIVRYRSLVGWAHSLGMKDAAQLLQQSLDEELSADDKLVAIGAEALEEALADESEEGAEEDEETTKGSKRSSAANMREPRKRSENSVSQKTS